MRFLGWAIIPLSPVATRPRLDTGLSCTGSVLQEEVLGESLEGEAIFYSKLQIGQAESAEKTRLAAGAVGKGETVICRL